MRAGWGGVGCGWVGRVDGEGAPCRRKSSGAACVWAAAEGAPPTDTLAHDLRL